MPYLKHFNRTGPVRTFCHEDAAGITCWPTTYWHSSVTIQSFLRVSLNASKASLFISLRIFIKYSRLVSYFLKIFQFLVPLWSVTGCNLSCWSARSQPVEDEPQLPVLTGDWSRSGPFRAAFRLLADCFARRAAAQQAELLSCLEYRNKRYDIWFWFGVFHAENTN